MVANLKERIAMRYLFVSTDSTEARKLLEGLGSHRCQYNNLDMHAGENLRARIGFNPMSSIGLDGLSERDVNRIIARLARERLYVASDDNGKVQSHIPTALLSSDYRV